MQITNYLHQFNFQALPLTSLLFSSLLCTLLIQPSALQLHFQSFKHTVSPKMDKYSKIKITSHSQNSRSIDFSDLQSFSPPQKTQETNLQIQKNTTTQDHDQEDEQSSNIGGERFGSHVKLKRNRSISSSASSAASGGFQSAVKGAFSMRRSSSVSERYCRIHDQSSTAILTSPIDDDEDQAGAAAWGTTRSMNKKRKGGKIFKASKEAKKNDALARVGDAMEALMHQNRINEEYRREYRRRMLKKYEEDLQAMKEDRAERDEKIMKIDTESSKWNPTQKKYWKLRQKEIAHQRNMARSDHSNRDSS